MREKSIVVGKIFGEIKSDERVTPDLSYCIYCEVIQSKENSFRNIEYRIPLDCINGNKVKQCPACKTIYIMRDPTE